MGHAPYGGALPGEVFALISRITDDESWRRQWFAMARKCESMARNSIDRISKGNNLLRASNYYRAAEFFIPPCGDNLEMKKELYRSSMKTFQEGLTELGTSFKIYQVPWKSGHMLVYFFPGDNRKPAVFIHGGYDSTNEESYFFTGAALIARGYPVIMFEGPGQSGMIREFGVRFTPHWHEPVGRIIDFMISREPVIDKLKKVLIGISLGGLLAGRAAAYEPRIDGVVLFGAPYDMVDAALFQMSSAGRWLYRNHFRRTIEILVGWKEKKDRAIRWGLSSGMWTVGGENAYDMLKAFEAYTLRDVHDKVRCHVLCIHGERDIYVSDQKQVDHFKTSFGKSASYTFKILKEEDGSAEHCQIGATEQASREIVNWLYHNNLVEIENDH